MFYYFHYFHCECKQASRNFSASAIERPRLATLGPSNGKLHRIPSLQQASRNTVQASLLPRQSIVRGRSHWNSLIWFHTGTLWAKDGGTGYDDE